MSKSLVTSRNLVLNLTRNVTSRAILEESGIGNGRAMGLGLGVRVQQQCRNLSSPSSSSSSSSSTPARTISNRTGFENARWRRSGSGFGALCGVKGGRGGGGESVRGYKTVQEAKSRYKSGPFSTLAGILFLASGAGLIFYFRYEKARMERKRVAEAAKGVGRPKVGGPFELVDQRGEVWGDEKMRGRYSLVYFGFSHCPDICPEELDKMAQMIDLVNVSPLLSSSSQNPDAGAALPPLLPIFITCDPARDTPAVLATYLSEFHPSLVGLTGTWEQIKDVCKKYRVYFSTPSGVKKGEDYLVDHSIYFYLMDPEGDFVEAIGRQHSPEEAARIILAHVGDWVKSR